MRCRGLWWCGCWGITGPGHNSYDYLVSQALVITATSRILYFAHILSPGDHMLGPDQMQRIRCITWGEDQWCTLMRRISDALWYVRGTQGDHCYNLIIKLEWNIFVTWARAGSLQKYFTWSTRDAKNTQLNPWWEWEKRFSWFNCYTFSSSLIA